MWEAFRSYYIFSHLCRTFPCLINTASVCCRNCPITSNQATYCVSFIPNVLRQTFTLSPVWWEMMSDMNPVGIPILHAGGFSGHDLAPGRNDLSLESAVISQSFPFSMDSIDSAWISWNRFLQPWITQPRNCLHHTIRLSNEKAYCKSLYSVIAHPVGLIEKKMGLWNRTQSTFLPSHLQRFWLLSTVRNKTRRVS